MTTESFLNLLNAAGIDLHAHDVLDALWLAQTGCALNLYAARREEQPASSGGTTPPPRKISGTRRSQQGTAPIDLEQLAGETAPAARADETPVYPSADWGEGEGTVKASPVLVPAGQALPGRLAYARAIRPFARRWASRRDRELDEERTVEMTADRNGELYPVFRPLAERWFDVDVVLEDDAAILVWQDVMREFCQMLRDTGAFRDVRRWRLRLGTPTDTRAALESPGGVRSPAALLTGGGARRLVFFATHGASAYWTDGAYARLLDPWTRSCAVSIVQLQPAHRWIGTPLGEATGFCSALQPGIPAAQLQIETFWWSLAAADEDALRVALPLLPLEPAALGDFAAMQMARGKRAPVVLLDASVVPGELPPPHVEPQSAERTLALLRESSPAAYQLAVYLSAGAFTLPVARLVQEAMFGAAAQQGHLADVLLCGLLTTSSKDPENDDPNQVYYEFTPEARAILVRSLREADVREVVASLESRVSRHIKEIYGRTVSFHGLVPDANGNYPLPAFAQPFARLSLGLLGLHTQGKTARQIVDAFHSHNTPAIVGRVARFAAAIRGGEFARSILGDALNRKLQSESLLREDAAGMLRFLPGVETLLADLVATQTMLGARILWVDDDPTAIAEEIGLFTSLGADITRVHTEDALSRERVDAIVSAELGEAVLSAIQAGDVPVILYPGPPDARSGGSALRAGVFASCVSPGELRQAIEEVLRLQDAPDRTEQARHRRMRTAIGVLGLSPDQQSLQPALLARDILVAATDRHQGFQDCLTLVQAYAASPVNQLIVPHRGEPDVAVIAEVADPHTPHDPVTDWSGMIGIAARTRKMAWAPNALKLAFPLLGQSGEVLGALNLQLSPDHALADDHLAWLQQFSLTLAAALQAVQIPRILTNTENLAFAGRIVRDLRLETGIEVSAIPEQELSKVAPFSAVLWPSVLRNTIQDVYWAGKSLTAGLWIVPLLEQGAAPAGAISFAKDYRAAFQQLFTMLTQAGVLARAVPALAPEFDPKQWHPPEDLERRGELTACTFTIKSNYQRRGARRWTKWGDVLVALDNPPNKDFVYLLPSDRAPRIFHEPGRLNRDTAVLEQKQRFSSAFVEDRLGKKLDGLWFYKTMADGTEHVHVYSTAYDDYLAEQLQQARTTPKTQVVSYPLVRIAAAQVQYRDNPTEKHGEFLMTRGTHRIDIPAQFRIGVHPVTNQQFLEFIQDGGYRDGSLWDRAPRSQFLTQDGTRGPSTWKKGSAFPQQKAAHPVSGISFLEARAFVKWLQRVFPQRGRVWCLPTEDMWELSARSPAGNPYPWGTEFRHGLCNSAESDLRGTSEVGRFPEGNSLYGCADMAGNVWEFVETPDRPTAQTCVLRGGSYSNNQYEIKSYLRLVSVPMDHRPPDFGFRCAQIIDQLE